MSETEKLFFFGSNHINKSQPQWDQKSEIYFILVGEIREFQYISINFHQSNRGDTF